MIPTNEDLFSILEISNDFSWGDLDFGRISGAPNGLYYALHSLGLPQTNNRRMYDGILSDSLHGQLRQVGKTHVFTVGDQVRIAGEPSEVRAYLSALSSSGHEYIEVPPERNLETDTRWAAFVFPTGTIEPDDLAMQMKRIKKEARNLAGMAPCIGATTPYDHMNIKEKSFGDGVWSTLYFADMGDHSLLRADFDRIDIVGNTSTVDFLAFRFAKEYGVLPVIFGGASARGFYFLK